MHHELASMQSARLSTEPLKIRADIGANMRVAMPQQGVSPDLRRGSVVPIAARNELRSSPVLPWLAFLQKCAGMAFVASAWLVFLWGMAHLILAAVHNQQGELGLGLDATLSGAKSCLGGFLLAAIGVPQWVMGNRKSRLAV